MDLPIPSSCDKPQVHIDENTYLFMVEKWQTVQKGKKKKKGENCFIAIVIIDYDHPHHHMLLTSVLACCHYGPGREGGEEPPGNIYE